MITQSIRRTPVLAALLGLMFLLGTTAAAPAAAESTDRYIVVLKDSVKSPANLARIQTENRDAKLGFVYRHALKGYAAELTKTEVEGLREDSRVKFITPDHKLRLFAQQVPAGIDRVFATANDALFIDEADDVRVDADVAVLDTGIAEHADLNIAGYIDCKTKVTECKDGMGGPAGTHGTHVAGTIGALDNDFGVVGVAPGVRLWSVRLDLSGVGGLEVFESSAIAGVDWVAATRTDEDPDNDIEVANMSFGCWEKSGGFPCPAGIPALDNAISAAVKEGVVMVAAAGNEKGNAAFAHPASHPDVITVSALADYDGKPGGEATPLSQLTPACTNAATESWQHYGLDDRLATFSNHGSEVDIAAPGVCVRSTLPGNSYGYNSGTSMAAPHVAGAAAILAAKDQPESKADVEAIRDTIVEEGNFAWEDTSGDGVKEPLLDVSDEAVFALEAPPMAETEAATQVNAQAAMLNATVNPRGLATTFQFEYGKTTAYGSKVPTSPYSVGSGTEELKKSWPLSGLEEATTYHFRVVATNAAGTTKGQDMTFTTVQGTAPVPVTGEVLEVKGKRATLTGEVNPGGLWTTYYFEYGPESAEGGTKAPLSPEGVGWGVSSIPVSEEIKDLDLEPGPAVYYFRLVATNSKGTSYGDEVLVAPAVTKRATKVDYTEATLNGLVNADEGEAGTEYWFEYGETTEYDETVGHVIVGEEEANENIAVSEKLTGLKDKTTYHYRVMAKSMSSEEIRVGEDMTFTTGPSVTFMDEGVPLELGTEVRGTSGNLILQMMGSISGCESAEFVGELVDNESNGATLEPIGDLQTTGCTLTGVYPMEVSLGLAPIRFFSDSLKEWGQGAWKADVGIESGEIAVPAFGFSCQIVGDSEPEYPTHWGPGSEADSFLSIRRHLVLAGEGCPSTAQVSGYFDLTLTDETPIQAYFDEW